MQPFFIVRQVLGLDLIKTFMRGVLKKESGMYWPAGVYAALTLLLWFLPLLNVLHVESSAVIAGVSFFIAGLSSLQWFAQRQTIGYVLRRQLLLLVIPLALLTVSLIWQHNCSYGQGLLFYLLFPPVTVIFGVGVASVLDGWGVSRSRTMLVLIGAMLIIGGPIYDLGFHAQFFTYNHVFGGVLGPIYDEEVTIRWGLLVFRGLTLLWALLFLLIGDGLRTHRWSVGRLAASGIVSVLILCTYIFAAPLRINTPFWFSQDKLGNVYPTAHFDIYYDADKIEPEVFEQIVDEHEYRYAYLKEKLGIDVSQRIESYIYPDLDTKDWLTGSRHTSVAPVWLRRPQMHIFVDHFEQVFAHELVHVFSREFGLPLINASLSVGLVEGLAVALEPSDGRPSPREQVLTASVAQADIGEDIQINASASLRSRLSPWGFWTGRGAVSYTTMGAFVRFLGETYGFDRVKQVYAYSDFETVFQKPVDELVEEWASWLRDVERVDRSTFAYVTRRFSIPSIFEKTCPHHLPPAVKYLRDATAALAAQDTLRAVQFLDASLAEEPAFQEALDVWAQLKLVQDQPEALLERLEYLTADVDSTQQPITAGLWLRMADASALVGDEEKARHYYQRTLDRMPLYAHEQRGLLALRLATAGHPDVLRILSGPAPVAERTDALLRVANLNVDIARLLSGILYASNDAYTPALAALQQVDLDRVSVTWGQKESLGRLIDMMMVKIHYDMKDYANARQKALMLAEKLRQIGAHNEAERYTDFAAKMEYISR